MCQTLLPNNSVAKRRLNNNVAGTSNVWFLAYFNGLLLLVPFQSKNVSAFNTGRSRLNLATTQTTNGLQSIKNSQLAHEKQ